MSKSDARFEYRSKLPRTDHDLSQPFGFTTAPGILSPIWFDYATPGDSYYITHDLDFMRTNPLIAPAMIDVKVHYESFFVPMQMLYQPFENSVFSIKPVLSSNFQPRLMLNTGLPCNDLKSIKEHFEGLGVNSKRADFRRLADLLELNLDYMDAGQGVAGSHLAFPYPFLAYQCIYQHYYRLDDKEEFDNTTYNYDKNYSMPEVVDHEDCFLLRYRPWCFDYFTSSYRSPIVSDANAQSILPNGKYDDLLGDNDPSKVAPISDSGLVNTGNTNLRSYAAYIGGVAPNNAALRESISTVMIRQMFANEKLAMITGRTKKNYDSQVLAHYGVPVPHDVKHDITLIGHDEFDLRVGEVTSLASTELTPLGEIAGKGWAIGQGKQQHKFTAPCHGVVMTIFSVEPIRRYYDTTNRLNTITDTMDLPTPEYDRLGNQPLFSYEAGVGDNRTVDVNRIAAWKERYYFSKRRVPRVSRAFMHYNDKQEHEYTPQLNPYASYFISSAGLANIDSQTNQVAASDLNTYLISPHSFDQLMLVPYVSSFIDGSQVTPPEEGENWVSHPYQQFSRDPLIVNSWIKCKKVSWMSKDGEPIYD